MTKSIPATSLVAKTLGQDQAIRVMIVDDEPVFRTSIASLNTKSRDIKIVAEASDGKTALQKLSSIRVDVVLSDIIMPGMDGVELAQKIRMNHKDIKFIAMTAFNEPSTMFHVLKAGAHGFILKSTCCEDIIGNIFSVVSGGTVISPDAARNIHRFLSAPNCPDSRKLPRREWDVLCLLHQGHSNAQIANQLWITESAVKKIVTRLFRRFCVKSRLQLITRTSKRF